MRTKAEFRAIRERLGMSRALVAEVLEIPEKTVSLWEDASSPRLPSDEAWEMLDEALEHQRAIVNAVIQRAMGEGERLGSKPSTVWLPYWLNQEEYDRYSDDAAYGLRGNVDMSNANAIATQIALESMGVGVQWAYMGE